MLVLKDSLPLVSIIIVNFNAEKFLESCLGSVFKQTKVPFEVIVVDNHSTDKSLRVLKEIKKGSRLLKIVALAQNVGPAEGRNLGVKKSQSQHLVFLDHDTEVGEDWLSRPLAYLENHPQIGAAQLKILKMSTDRVYDSAGEKLTNFGFLSERARSAEDVGQFDKVEDIFSGKTAAMIVQREVFNKIGGFDEDYFMYWEEPDLCWRIWKLGYRVVFLPRGKVWHAYGTKEKKVSPAWDTQITYLGCRNQIATIAKNGVGWQGLRMFLAVLSIWTILFLMFIARSDFKKARAVLSAFGYLLANRKTLLNKRAELKKRLGSQFASDKYWFDRVQDKRGLSWYWGKGLAYLTGKPF